MSADPVKNAHTRSAGGIRRTKAQSVPCLIRPFAPPLTALPGSKAQMPQS
jgi:hypothetical protein